MFVPCFIEQVDRNKRTVPMFDQKQKDRPHV